MDWYGAVKAAAWQGPVDMREGPDGWPDTEDLGEGVWCFVLSRSGARIEARVAFDGPDDGDVVIRRVDL